MEEFEKIKEMTHESLKSNVKNFEIVSNWKDDVRASLIRLRKKFNNLIDKFIYQFG